MKTLLMSLAGLSLLLVADCPGQVTLSGQSAASLYKTARTHSPLSLENGAAAFGWEFHLFVDGRISDNITALATVEASDEDSVSVGYAAIRVSDLSPLHLTIQAGKFDLPFGDLGERRFPRRNPLYRLPLIHEYQTGIVERALTDGALLFYRGKAFGLRLLNRGMYDVGAMVSGSWGVFDYSFALSEGTVSGSSYVSGTPNSDLGKTVRLSATPCPGLTLGASYGWGAYMVQTDLSDERGIDVNAMVQKTAGVDVEYSVDHLVLSGEGVYTVWPASLEGRTVKLTAAGCSAEAMYTIMPRLYVAFRAGGISFGSLVLNGVNQEWDYPVLSVEGGIGYFLDRDILVKLVRNETRIAGGSHPKDNITAIQLAIAY